MKKQSFLTGAVILMIANAISKILGAVFKIPLTYILNESGMAVFNIAFEVYIMFLSFIISGLPFAISKLVAEETERGERGGAQKIVAVSTVLLALIGAAGSAALYFGADFFAPAMKEEKAVWAIRIIAPSIFLVALGTPFKSYYQGVSNMIPTAVSQVAEAIIKLAAGYYLAVYFVSFGVEKTAGGAIMGVTAGELAATAILIMTYLWGKNKVYIKSSGDTREIIKKLMSIALPLLCASVVSNAINIADTTLVRSRLLDAGFSAEDARFLYGAYTGYALTVFHLPVGILATMGVSILPVIAGAIAVNNMKKARLATDIGIRLAVLLSVPCAVIMCMLSGEILSLLFNNDASARMLSTVAPCVVMMCVTQITGAILQSAGKIMLPFYNSLAGSAVKIGLSYYLIGIPEINIYGSAISSIAAFTLVMILNLISVRRHLCLKQNIMEILIKPAVSAAAMTAVMCLLRRPLMATTGGGFAYLTLMCASGFGVYALSLVAVKAVSVRDARQILRT